jgi:hypothetical protein
MKRPAHIVPNLGRDRRKICVGKWVNLLTDEVYVDDAALEAYLSTYIPLPEWYTWDSWQKKKNSKIAA